MQKPPDFTFNVALPVYLTDEEELSMPLEPYLEKIIEAGYASREEVISYVKFASQMSAMTPFMFDEFLNVYRRTMEQKEKEGEEEPKRKADLWTPR